MSFDYFVAIKKEKWPNAAAVQAGLRSLGVPLELQAAPDEPFSAGDRAYGLPVVFEGRRVVLEAEIEQATDADDSESIFGYIAHCAAPEFEISNGDYF